MIKKAEIITILAGLLFVYITDSARAVINDVQITPDEPTTEDIIAVVTFGTESSRPVKVIDTDVDITDSEIGVDLTLELGPFFEVTEWSYSVDIGRLSAGTYDLTVRTIVNSVLTDTYFKTFQVMPAPPMTLDGSGTQQDPWLIQSLDDFNEFAAIKYYWDDYTRLETDVNLAGMVYERAVIAWDVNDEESGFQGTEFRGVFDGNNHTISNFKYDCNEVIWVGVFGCIRGANPEIKNLGLIAPNVNAGTGQYVGSLVGYNLFGTIINCFVEGGIVAGSNRVGGLVGLSHFGTITNCYSTGDVRGQEWVGGLVGVNGSSISDCYSTGDVNGVDYVGGLAGWSRGSVSNCYSTGDVRGQEWVGGLVGENWSSISNCYSTGDVNGVDYVGGLVGSNGGWHPSLGGFHGYVFGSYSTGSIQGASYVGGLVGYNELGDIEKSCWDIETSNEPNMCGYQHSNATGCDPNYGLPTTQMKKRSTFTDADWDFINVWNIGENQTYPYLRTFFAADLNKDGIVNFLDLSITANQWMKEE